MRALIAGYWVPCTIIALIGVIREDEFLTSLRHYTRRESSRWNCATAFRGPKIEPRLTFYEWSCDLETSGKTLKQAQGIQVQSHSLSAIIKFMNEKCNGLYSVNLRPERSNLCDVICISSTRRYDNDWAKIGTKINGTWSMSSVKLIRRMRAMTQTTPIFRSTIYTDCTER